MVVGVLTSVPDAVITKAYAPIPVTGTMFGAGAGLVGRVMEFAHVLNQATARLSA